MSQGMSSSVCVVLLMSYKVLKDKRKQASYPLECLSFLGMPSTHIDYYVKAHSDWSTRLIGPIVMYQLNQLYSAMETIRKLDIMLEHVKQLQRGLLSLRQAQCIQVHCQVAIKTMLIRERWFVCLFVCSIYVLYQSMTMQHRQQAANLSIQGKALA